MTVNLETIAKIQREIDDVESFRRVATRATSALNAARDEAIQELADVADEGSSIAAALSDALATVSVRLRHPNGVYSLDSSDQVWKYREQINPALVQYGFKIVEHDTLRNCAKLERI